MSEKNWWEESDGRLVVDDVNEAVLELHAEVQRLRDEVRLRNSPPSSRSRAAFNVSQRARAEKAEAEVERLRALLDTERLTRVLAESRLRALEADR